MPTYDYQCRSCGHIIEVIHPMHEDGPSACDRCGGELRRILHPAGIIFKGSGFYKTDSRSAGSASVPAGTTKATPASTDTGGSAAAPDTGKSTGSGSPPPGGGSPSSD